MALDSTDIPKQDIYFTQSGIEEVKIKEQLIVT